MDNSALKSEILNFRDITLEIIVCLEKDDIENVNQLFLDRQNVINKINKLNYNKAEFKNICREIDVISPDKKLYELLSEKKQSAKDDMNRFFANKNANSMYKNSFGARAVFYNKKI